MVSTFCERSCTANKQRQTMGEMDLLYISRRLHFLKIERTIGKLKQLVRAFGYCNISYFLMPYHLVEAAVHPHKNEALSNSAGKTFLWMPWTAKFFTFRIRSKHKSVFITKILQQHETNSYCSRRSCLYGNKLQHLVVDDCKCRHLISEHEQFQYGHAGTE